MFAYQQARDIAEDVLKTYRLETILPFAEEWLKNRVRPSDLDAELKKIAKLKVKKDFENPPKLLEPNRPDNSGSNLSIFLFLLTMGVGIFLGVAMHPMFGVVAGLSSFFWLFMGSMMGRDTPETMLAKASIQHEKALADWSRRRIDCTRDVARILRRRLHLEIAATTKVPDRLLVDFLEVMEANSTRYRKDWLLTIREWESKPKFAEPPRAIQQGVSPFEYEQFCAETLISWGYGTARRTRQSKDGGVDIVCDELAVQCKRYAGSVGVSPVREIFGVASHVGKTAVIITEGTFTSSAKEFANAAGVALFKLDARIGDPKPLNDYATKVMKHHQ
jgi:HJR/Mrr/RecB family endonuclease